MKTKLVALLCAVLFASCTTKNQNTMEPYVIETATFKIKSSVKLSGFWIEDTNIQNSYTSKQPGYISRESGYSKDTNEVLVVVKWKTNKDAEASMQKFMEDETVVKFINMIEPNSMQMKRYTVQ